MPDTFGLQPTLHNGTGIWLCLGKLVIDKFCTIVGLDALEREGWFKEANSMLEKVDSVSWINARVQAFVFNPRCTVDDVVLVSSTLPVLNIQLTDLARGIDIVTHASLGALTFLAWHE